MRYDAYGSVRGSCGHTHRSEESAQRCVDQDAAACARLSGGAYSDRYVRPIDGEARSLMRRRDQDEAREVARETAREAAQYEQRKDEQARAQAAFDRRQA